MPVLGPYIDLTKEPAGDHLFYITVDDQSKVVCEDGITLPLAHYVYDIKEKAYVCVFIDAEKNLYRSPWSSLIQSYQRGTKFSNGEWLTKDAIHPNSLFKMAIDPTNKLSPEKIAELDKKLLEVAEIAKSLAATTASTTSTTTAVSKRTVSATPEISSKDEIGDLPTSIKNAAAILEAALGKPDGEFIKAWKKLKKSCTTDETYCYILYCVINGAAVENQDDAIESNAIQLRSYLITASDNSDDEIKIRKFVLNGEREELFKKIYEFDPKIISSDSTPPAAQQRPKVATPANTGMFSARRIGPREAISLLVKNTAERLGFRQYQA